MNRSALALIFIPVISLALGCSSSTEPPTQITSTSTTLLASFGDGDTLWFDYAPTTQQTVVIGQHCESLKAGEDWYYTEYYDPLTSQIVKEQNKVSSGAGYRFNFIPPESYWKGEAIDPISIPIKVYGYPCDTATSMLYMAIGKHKVSLSAKLSARLLDTNDAYSIRINSYPYSTVTLTHPFKGDIAIDIGSDGEVVYRDTLNGSYPFGNYTYSLRSRRDRFYESDAVTDSVKIVD